jgi:hypothetical protein
VKSNSGRFHNSKRAPATNGRCTLFSAPMGSWRGIGPARPEWSIYSVAFTAQRPSALNRKVA